MFGIVKIVLLAFVVEAHALEASADNVVDNLLHRILTASMLHHSDLNTATLAKPGPVATPSRAHVGLLVPLPGETHRGQLRSVVASARLREPLTVAAQQKSLADNTGVLMAASVGVVGAALAGAAALDAGGILPQDQAQAAVVFCVGGVTTYGMFRGGPFFREDPWEHSAEMMARSDAGLMGPTSARPPLSATPPGDAAITALRDQGVVRLNGVISPEEASTARSAVIERLDTVLSQQQGQKEDRTKLGKVTCGKRRYDLLLQPENKVLESVMREALQGPLGELMKREVGEDAPLYELAALVSDKGAGRQPVQVDTPYQAEPLMYTAMVALQDEDVELGPTLFLPGTHTENSYKDFVGGDGKRSELLSRTPFFGSMLSTGDCAVFDSRLMHANAQNVKGKRAMLYFTFAKPTTDLSQVGGFPASISPDARGGYRLADFLPKA
eukprot:gnl/MRDRNA2_/MRDRNA2_127450_c0_seq1.p1 gnl/MRDRNA2_/MRDRNA2_127450_c0~~gnl/MRDRNA2_/MRDRNA2_127450_c0_seq1.p1  ORF type:complete len:442 (-),score=101.73 gnl/MRDRNA2_/MRDRNA2_127450_c0_seq1:51-1376(-)